MILFTDNDCRIGDRSFPRIPLLLDEEGKIMDAPSDFLRYRVVELSKASTTVREDAFKLQLWFRFLAYHQQPWQEVDQHWLRRFRDALVTPAHKPWLRQSENAGAGLTRQRRSAAKKSRCDDREKATVNALLALIFDFYVWAQHEGLVIDLVRSRDVNPNQKYPIATKLTKNGRLITTLLFATVRKANRHTPTEQQIENLHAVTGAAAAKHANRNTLIMLWFEEAMLRRAGALTDLTVDKIPSY